MSDAQGWLTALWLLAGVATVVLYGYHRRGGRQAIRYLYAGYAALVVWLGTMLGLLALSGDARLALAFAAVFAVGVPATLIRDKRRQNRKA